MSDRWALEYGGLDAPAANAEAVTPSDTVNLSNVTRGIYVSGAGNLKVDMANTGTAVIFTALAAGIVHPLRVKRVYAAGTTATGIIGLY